jgi:hypothetical protein
MRPITICANDPVRLGNRTYHSVQAIMDFTIFKLTIKRKGENMFKQLDLKAIGGIAIIAILLLASIYLYSQWSYKRFTSELGVPPQSTTPSESVSEDDTIKSTEQSNSTLSPESVNGNLEVKPKTTVESESIDITEDKEVSAEITEESEFDPTHLLPAFGLPEEVASLLDGETEAEDFAKAQAYLQEKYGQSSEVEAIMDKLKQMSGGPVELDDLTALLEAWIQILPKEQQENRQLMRVLTMLRQNKGQITNIYIETIPIDE